MDYSIAIGIDNYLEKDIDETPCAENDAKEYSNVMQEQFCLEKNILLLGKEATKTAIVECLENIPANKGDRVFLFFAGHGNNVYNDPKLCCYDSKRDAIASITTWLDLKQIMGLFVEKRVDLICFIDACNSSITYSSRGMTNIDTDITSDNYVYVFASANSDEKALSDKKLQHGIWSNFLLSALKGDKEALTNNCLTNNSLQNFLNKKVIDYYSLQGENPTQIPQAWGKTAKEFIIKDFSESVSTSSVQMVQDVKRIPIKNFYFGTVDADNEIKEQPSKFVENYFDLNDVSKELLEKDNIQFVIGRKGTGKTYIGKYMELTDPEHICYLSLDNFDYKAFRFLANKGSGYEPYVGVWRYFIFAKLLIFINNNLKSEKIKLVLNDLYGRRSTTEQILNRKFKKEIRLKEKEIASEWMQDLAKDTDAFDLKELTQMYSILIADNVQEKYLLILDGLDEKINEDEHYRDIMNGLIWAIKSINDEMYEERIPVKVAAFFRKDVFDFVQGANTAKMASGSTIELDWVTDSDDKKKYPLYQFMNIRYQNCLKDFEIDASSHEIIEILPPYMKVVEEKKETWEWILNFTTYKPRDVVKMLSECRKKCKNDESVLTAEILWEAQPEYSKYLIKELKNELYGFIEESLVNAIFERLQSMERGWRDYLTIKSIINKGAVSIGMELSNDMEKEIINKLYEVGVLGILLPNGYEHWSYRRNMKIGNYIEVSKYKVHHGLWKALSIW